MLEQTASAATESTKGYRVVGEGIHCQEVHTDYGKAIDQLDDILDKTCFCVHGKIVGYPCKDCEGGRAVPELKDKKWETVRIVEVH